MNSLLLPLWGSQAAEAAEGASFWMPPQASTIAADSDFVFYFIYWVCVICFVIMMGALGYFVLLYRQKTETDTVPLIKGSHALEIGWSIIPTIFMAVMFWYGFQLWIDLAVPPADSMEVRVTGQKWVWSYSYSHNGKVIKEAGVDAECMDRIKDPTRDIECNTPLRVPAGKPIKLVMNSIDVLHSFYVPDFRVKKDVVPGRYTVLWFEAPEPGEHNVFCTEYCGDRHGYMYSKVIVMPPDEFDAWLQMRWDETTEGPRTGEMVYQQEGCAGCHSIDGAPGVGPSFKGLYGRMEKLADGSSVMVDDNYLRESILVPGAKVVAGFAPSMPPFQGRLSDEEVANTIDYIKTLAD
jgi:cytochrome c oxidase subunit 2